MPSKAKLPFDPKVFLAQAAGGRTVSQYRKNQIIFSQGDLADSVEAAHQSGEETVSLLQNYGRRIRSQPLHKTLAFLFQPKKLWFHASRIFFGRTGQIQNFYPESDREIDLAFCAEVLGCTRAVADQCFAELEGDHEFLGQLSATYRAKRLRDLHLGRFRCSWAIVRLRQPKLVIETGVHDGLSSTMILYALHKNRTGSLISIDLPSVDMPGVDSLAGSFRDSLTRTGRSTWGTQETSCQRL